MLEIAATLGTTLDLHEMLIRVMAKITELLGAERSSLFLIDHERREVWSTVAQGSDVREIRLPIDRGLVGHVARSGEVVNVNDAYADPRFHAEVDRATGFTTRSVLAVPLRGKDARVTGVAEVLNRPGGFTDEDEQTLLSVAPIIGLSLENAQLYTAARTQNDELRAAQDELNRKVAEVDLLLVIEQTISDAKTLDEMLAAILGHTMKTFRAHAGVVLLTDDGAVEMHCALEPGAQVEVRSGFSIPRGSLLERAIDQGEPIAVASSTPLEGTLLSLAGGTAKAVLCAPLLVTDSSGAHRTVGALELAATEGVPFRENDRRVASAVARQIARAVDVARGRAESERTNRLAMLGQMLGGVVHDLRSPMTVISGYAELLAREPDPVERDRFSHQIMTQLDQVNGMTQEVLAFIRGERHVLLRRVVLTDFWFDLREVLARELEPRKIDLQVKLDYAGAIRADVGKLRRLITNLSRNAAQAITNGGVFQVRCSADGDALVIDVADDGPGLPPSVAARVFSAFNSEGKAGGTGLGLALVKEIVDSHGGQVTCTSAPGQGTAFHIRIPKAILA